MWQLSTGSVGDRGAFFCKVRSAGYFTTKSLMRLHGALGFVLTNLLQIVDQFIDIVVLLRFL